MVSVSTHIHLCSQTHPHKEKKYLLNKPFLKTKLCSSVNLGEVTQSLSSRQLSGQRRWTPEFETTPGPQIESRQGLHGRNPVSKNRHTRATNFTMPQLQSLGDRYRWNPVSSRPAWFTQDGLREHLVGIQFHLALYGSWN